MYSLLSVVFRVFTTVLSLEFQKGVPMDVGPNAPLSTTGRAYFGDYLEGDVTATDFGTYSNASGAVASTLEAPLAVHIQQLTESEEQFLHFRRVSIQEARLMLTVIWHSFAVTHRALQTALLV